MNACVFMRLVALTKLVPYLHEMSLVAMASDKYCYYVVLIPKENEIREKYKFTRLSRGILRNTIQIFARTICFQGDMGEDISTRQVLTKYLGKRSTKSALRGLAPTARRRTALTRMSDAGVPLRHIQSISGHRTLSALERYLGVTDQQKQSAIATLDF